MRLADHWEADAGDFLKNVENHKKIQGEKLAAFFFSADLKIPVGPLQSSGKVSMLASMGGCLYLRILYSHA